MATTNFIVNGDFETGLFSPWMGYNSVVTSSYSHCGSFSAQLQNGNSVVYQVVKADFSKPLEFTAHLAKVGTLPNAQVSIVISYFDCFFNFIGTGLVVSIPEEGLADVIENNWLEISKTSEPAPSGTSFAILTISRNNVADTADVLLDDVTVLAVEDTQE